MTAPASAPRVSVIMRTRNRPDLLVRAVADVLAQTFRDLELIIVDDADEPAAAASVVAALTPDAAERIRLISRAGAEHGRWPAANAGLEAARGEFVSLHDDDDYWDPRFLDTVVGYFDSHPAAMAVCTRTDIVIEREDTDGELHRTDTYPFLPELNAVTLTDMLRANRIPPISLLYRRSLHDALGPFDASLRFLGDWDFYLRIIGDHPIELVDGPALAFWSHRPQSTGDGENSISASQLRAVTDASIRDARIREGIARSGPGLFVHIAHESMWLDSRAEARSATQSREISELGERIAAPWQSVEAELRSLRQEVAALRTELREHTGLGVLLRRLRRRLRR